MADSKLVPAERNVMAFNQIAKKVAATVETYRLVKFPDPVQVPPHHLLVSQNNRGGQPLTLMVVHQVIIPSFQKDGFDPSRTPVGFTIWYETSAVKENGIAHNLTLYGGSPLYPPIEREVVEGETLSCSHYNCTLRCYRAQLTSVDGHICDASKDADLQVVVERGHKWYLLSEKTPVAEQKMLSEWKNQDQNSNQVRHEIELIRSIQTVCLKEATVAQRASITTIANAVNLASPVKMSNSTMHSLVKFVMSVGADHATIDRVCHHHAMTVNPNERVLLHTFYDAVGQELASTWKHLSAAVVMAAYSPDSVKHNVRPSPDHCSLFSPGDVKTLAGGPKQGDVFTYVEAALQTAVDTYLPFLAKATTQRQAGEDVDALFIQTAHLVWGKKWATVFQVKDLTPGKPTPEKLTELVHTWVRWVDSRYQTANFATSFGVKTLASTTPDGDTTFDLPSLPQGPFKVGEQLVVKNRFTACVPVKGNSEFRCDLQVGEEAIITDVGLLETEGKVTVAMSKVIQKTLVHFKVEAKVDNLARPSAVPAPPEKTKTAKQGTPNKPTTVPDAAPAWTKRVMKNPKTGEDIDAPTAIVDKQWSAHLRLDKGTQVTVAKHWATASMHLLSTVVPTYDAKTDLLVVKRGAAVEVWTKRDFKKNEIVFAPVSTIVKDHYWTKGRSVLLQGGSALHPSHKHFVMEKSTLVAEDEDYTFSLFWAVERTNDSSEANLHLVYPKMEVEASVVLPNGRKAVQADAMHAAALVPPVLTNQARVGQHTRLVAINDLNLQKIDEEKELKRKQDKADAAASAAKKARVQ